MVGIDQSRTGLGDKAHKDGPTTAMTAPQPCKKKRKKKKQPTTTPPPLTTHQLSTNHMGSEGEHAGVASPHPEATGMERHTAAVSL